MSDDSDLLSRCRVFAAKPRHRWYAGPTDGIRAALLTTPAAVIVAFKSTSLRRAPPLALLIVLLVLSLVLGLSWLVAVQHQSRSSQKALEAVRIRTARIHNLDVLLLRTLDAESGVRSYLLSNNPVHLTPYQNAASEIEQALTALRAESRPQRPAREVIDQLGELIEQRLELLRRDIEQGSVADVSDAAGGRGKQLTDEIRSRLLELRASTLEQSQAAQEEAHSRFNDVRAINLVLGVGVLGLLLALTVALFREHLLRREIARLLASENERLQAEVDIRTAELNRLASYLTNLREVEQQRVAHELHDELGILLTAARFDAGWLLRKLPQQTDAVVHERIKRLIETLARAIAAKRKLVAELRPPLLADLGLVDALRALTHSKLDTEIRIETDLPDDLPPLKGEVSLALYRVAQEALENVHRHAGAAQVKLALHHDERTILLRVEDDGTGFDQEANSPLSKGLAEIAHRLRMLGGQLRVNSRIGHGTVLEALLPLQPN